MCIMCPAQSLAHREFSAEDCADSGLLSPRSQERISCQLWPWVLSSVVPLSPGSAHSQSLKKGAQSMLVEGIREQQ